MRKRLAFAAATAVALVASGAPEAADDKIDLATWDQSRAYRGIRATESLDWKVRGETGQEIARWRASTSTGTVR